MARDNYHYYGKYLSTQSKDYDKIRAYFNASKLEYKIRECLNCDDAFDSVSNENRICDRCKKHVAFEASKA